MNRERRWRSWQEWRRALLTFSVVAMWYLGTVTGYAISNDWNTEVLILAPFIFALGAVTMRVWIYDAPVRSEPSIGEVRCMCGWSHECMPDQAMAAIRHHIEFGNCSEVTGADD